MDDTGVETNAVLFREVFKDGATLLVVARKIEKEQWALSVQNEFGTTSNWLDFFAGAQQAIDAGIAAIEKEGIEPFTSIEGFEYLLEDAE